MRENRAKESKEASNERKNKDNEATKEALANETEEESQIRLAKNRKYKEDRNQKETVEQKKERNIREAAQRKARRHAAKLAKTQNPVLAEFQKIQTVPRSLSIRPQGSKSLSQEGSLSSESDNAESMSEYERLRLQNIEERNQKFQERFGNSDPFKGPSVQNKKRSLSKSAFNSETSDEEIAQTPTRRQPKRQCKTLTNESSVSDSSFEAYVDDLVESSVNAIDTKSEVEQIVCLILEEIISLFIAAPKLEYLRSKKGQPKIGRKSKDAKRMANSRYVI